MGKLKNERKGEIEKVKGKMKKVRSL